MDTDTSRGLALAGLRSRGPDGTHGRGRLMGRLMTRARGPCRRGQRAPGGGLASVARRLSPLAARHAGGAARCTLSRLRPPACRGRSLVFMLVLPNAAAVRCGPASRLTSRPAATCQHASRTATLHRHRQSGQSRERDSTEHPAARAPHMEHSSTHSSQSALRRAHPVLGRWTLSGLARSGVRTSGSARSGVVTLEPGCGTGETRTPHHATAPPAPPHTLLCSRWKALEVRTRGPSRGGPRSGTGGACVHVRCLRGPGGGVG
jgi:hypothetical protein